MLFYGITLLALPLMGFAGPVPRATSTAPTTVQLDYATFQGKSSNGVDSYLGMPFAAPPIGDLRLRLAVFPPPNMGSAIQNATSYGLSCTQQQVTDGLLDSVPSDLLDIVESIPGLQPVTSGDGEDCLTINVQVPTPGTVAAGTSLPVVVWIYGGGFANGGTSQFDGSPIVSRSVATGSPIVYVSMNYRLNGFGFLASKEVSAAGLGNMGLDDQRKALQWIQKYIGAFGGDPTKVTIWGESAGAISVAMQLLTNGGNPAGLFRGAFMESGSPIPTGDYTLRQKYYDSIVKTVGCQGEADTLACLRTIEYQTMRAAIDQTPSIFAYQSLNLPYVPHADGTFLTGPPQVLMNAGQYAKVPLITGDCDDEGTLFTLAQLNITTSNQTLTYIHDNYAPNATAADIAQIGILYPDDPTQGSPFNTSSLNSLTPQNKRIAAFQGDLVFQAPRRAFLNVASKTQNTWSFLYKRGKATPFFGTYHSMDQSTEFYLPVTGGYDNIFIDYLVNFVTNLDPNAPASRPSTSIIPWPKWTTSTPNLMTFVDPLAGGGTLGLLITLDTYRAAAMNFLMGFSLKNFL